MRSLWVKVIVVLVIVCLGIGVYYSLKSEGGKAEVPQTNNVQVDKDIVIEKDTAKYYRFKDKDLNIAVFSRPFEIAFNPKKGGTVEEQAKRAGFDLAINGSYFRGEYFDAEHAGLLQLKGELIEPKGTDKQLTHFIEFDTVENKISFKPIGEYKKENYLDKKYTLVQTGPLIMENNVIAKDYINASINGNGLYLRTALGYTNTGETFFVVTTTRYNLEELGNTVKGLEIFKDKNISLINLDGGTSTAIYSKDIPELNFNANIAVPIIFGIK
jgi:exopolysaccharide biosynthesis protein